MGLACACACGTCNAPPLCRSLCPLPFSDSSSLYDNLSAFSVSGFLIKFETRNFQAVLGGDSVTFSVNEMSSPSKRRDMDVMKLMMGDYVVETINDGINEFNVEFHGPKENAYIYKSPSIGFMNKIYHPNVDELSGSVCLDVINQSWSPMFDLLNVFEVFLPQILQYPNPLDPLNGDAASLMMKDLKQYEQKVKEYCERYAKNTDATRENSDEELSDDEDVCDDQSASIEEDDDVAGHEDP